MSGLLESKSDDEDDLNEPSLSSISLMVGSLFAISCLSGSNEGPDCKVSSLSVWVAAIGSEKA